MRSLLPIVHIAKIASIFGKNGELAIRLYDTFCGEPNFEEPFFVDIDGLEVPLFLKTFSRKGNNKAVVVFEDIDNEFRASELLGRELYAYPDVNESDDDDDDDEEVYFEDVIGYSFIDNKLSVKGVVSDFIDNQFNPLLVVTTDDEVEVLIPVSMDNIIEDIDKKNRLVELNIPLEIFELYVNE